MVVTAMTRVRAGPNVHAREFDGELILVDLQGGDYFGLDEIGGRVWRELADGRTPTEIAALLADEYDVTPSQLLADVVSLLTDLAERGLVAEVT